MVTERGRRQVEEFYHQWGSLVYRRCLRILHDEEEARDAVQEVFLRIYRYIDRYEDDDKGLNFVYRVTTNHCLNRLRTRRRKPPPLPLEPRLHIGGEDPGFAVASREMLRLGFGELGEEEALIVYLRYYEDLTQDRIAQITGLSRKSVGRKLERSLRKMKARLTK